MRPRPYKRLGLIYHPDICEMFRLPFLAQRCLAVARHGAEPRFVGSLRSPGAVRFGRPFRPVGRSVTGRQVETIISSIPQQRSFPDVCNGFGDSGRLDARSHTPLWVISFHEIATNKHLITWLPSHNSE